ncbi:hypothetical protein [Bartonella fuyuanensis]|uniref:hypothetical protein n=1 Tax=Bartonella fuyuanensis TaxID=1460968 RepID=UPI001FE9A02A|nr:hypothetical protein [Bartonella fuyuanensis]
MIAPGFPLILKDGSQLTKQQEAIALEAGDQLQELFSVKASKEDIAKALRMLSCGLKISQQSDHEGMALTYGMVLENVSAWSLMTTVKRILCDDIGGLSDTFFPSTRELVRLCRDLENSLLTKANLVRKAILNTREKLLKGQEAKEHFSPLTAIHKQELAEVLKGLRSVVKNIEG